MFVSFQILLTIIQMTNAVSTILDVLGVFIVIKFQNIRQVVMALFCERRRIFFILIHYSLIKVNKSLFYPKKNKKSSIYFSVQLLIVFSY